MTGETYLTRFAIPNFYFHATTAYAILRENGFQIGKQDLPEGRLRRLRHDAPAMVDHDRTRFSPDAGEIATLYLASRAEALPYLRRCHSDEDTRGWIATMMLVTGETWIAREAGRILGFVTLNGEELDQPLSSAGAFQARHRLAAARQGQGAQPGTAQPVHVPAEHGRPGVL